jgi:hypothetical protein
MPANNEEIDLSTGMLVFDEGCVVFTKQGLKFVMDSLQQEHENSLAFAKAQIAGMQVEINNLNELLDQYR